MTQYTSWPAKSGVQRVLLHLAGNWGGERIDAQFGFVDGSSFVIGPLAQLASVIRSTFAAGASALSAATIRETLRCRANAQVLLRDVEGSFESYLLPEPTLRKDTLRLARGLRDSGRVRPYFLYFDAIPLTHPRFFAKVVDTDGSVTRYHQTLAGMEHVAFISAASRETFESRIARRALESALVAPLGSDGLVGRPSKRPERPTFTMLGTVEPRKQHALVLDAFERLWASGRDYALVVLGAAGAGHPALLDRLRRLAAAGLVDWVEASDDAIVADAISNSSAVVFPPAAEGAGLPALEALALGCPLIVSADVPALAGIASAGQIRLKSVDPDAVARAVEALADPVVNDDYRHALKGIQLPTWATFAAAVESWVADSLAAR